MISPHIPATELPPLFMLWLRPAAFCFFLVSNIVIDFAVLSCFLEILNIHDRRRLTLKKLPIVSLFGLVTDFACAGILFALTVIPINLETEYGMWWQNTLMNAVCYNPFKNIWAFLLVLAAVAVCGLLIYLFNRYVTFARLAEPPEVRRNLCIALAVLTPPVMFLMPTMFFA